MPGKPRPSVRFYLPDGARVNQHFTIKLRGVAGYNRKRVLFPQYIEPFQVCAFTTAVQPDGSFVPEIGGFHNPNDIETKIAKGLSLELLDAARMINKIIARIVEADLWDKMTSADMNAIYSNYSPVIGGFNGIVETNDDEVMKLVEKWIKAKEGSKDGE